MSKAPSPVCGHQIRSARPFTSANSTVSAAVPGARPAMSVHDSGKTGSGGAERTRAVPQNWRLAQPQNSDVTSVPSTEMGPASSIAWRSTRRSCAPPRRHPATRCAACCCNSTRNSPRCLPSLGHRHVTAPMGTRPAVVPRRLSHPRSHLPKTRTSGSEQLPDSRSAKADVLG